MNRLLLHTEYFNRIYSNILNEFSQNILYTQFEIIGFQSNYIDELSKFWLFGAIVTLKYNNVQLIGLEIENHILI